MPIPIQGKHNTAVCFAAIIEDGAWKQIYQLCNMEAFAASKIRIMPDVHAGIGCTIGTTMTLSDKAVPNMVGVDIGCGMETVRLAERSIDFAALDDVIHSFIPAGFNVRETPHPYAEAVDLDALRCRYHIDTNRARLSIGTLGGGNHFIEVDTDEDGNLFLVVHSGSRHLGGEIAKYYQDAAYAQLKKDTQSAQIQALKAAGKHKEIEAALKLFRAGGGMKTPKDQAYVQGKLFEDYIHDMKVAQHFAALNRQAITRVILERMGLTEIDRFTTIHNFIDTEAMILRKGAVSAKAGERLLIPMNMRDGSLLCVGKGNADWNYSAPHGAGRILSRKQALEKLTVDEFQTRMQGIYTTCIGPATLDESPMAYKPMDSIVSEIGETVEIQSVIRPLYNFKTA
jgi:RNA-splicing ligase RtcB